MLGLLAELALKQEHSAAVALLWFIIGGIIFCLCWLRNLYRNLWIKSCCDKLAKECTCGYEREPYWEGEQRCPECQRTYGRHEANCSQR